MFSSRVAVFTGPTIGRDNTNQRAKYFLSITQLRQCNNRFSKQVRKQPGSSAASAVMAKAGHSSLHNCNLNLFCSNVNHRKCHRKHYSIASQPVQIRQLAIVGRQPSFIQQTNNYIAHTVASDHIIEASRSKPHTYYSYEKIAVLCMYVCECVCSDMSSTCSSCNCACASELACVRINQVKVTNFHCV